RRWIEKLQAPVRTFLENFLGDQNAALFRALILGERQAIDRNLRETFNRSGLGHVLAVSGLHIGLVAWAAFWLFNWGLSRSYRLLLLTDIRKWSALLTCFPVVAYTLLAGCRVSSERAMIMVLAYLFSIILGKEKDVWSTFSLAGLIILFLDPGALFTPSFQLSFVAVTGILWLTPPILKRLGVWTDGLSEYRSRGRSAFTYVTGLAAVSFCALYFLLPLTVYYFHRIPLVSLPANLSTIPILGLWVLPWGLLSVLLLPFSPQVAALLLHVSAWGLDIMMGVVAFWSSFPWASIWMVTPGFFETGLFYSLTFFAFFAFQKKWARMGLAAIVFLTVMDVAFWVHRVSFNQDLEVVFLDVGKGNAALVCLPDGKTMMIDGGGFSNNRFDVGKMVIAPFLWHRKIRTVNYLVLTHPQADHMNGLRFITEAFHPEQFWYNGDQVETRSFKNLMAALDKQDVHIKEPAQLSDKIRLNGAEIEVLHPEPGIRINDMPLEGKDLNNRSMVLKITFAGVSILFPGDIEDEGEKRLLRRVGARVRSDILLSPHHGSRTSSSEAFLKMVAPEICVISSGEDRYNRFPDPLVLKRLAEIECKSICIAHSGAVAVRVGPDGFVEIHSFLSEDSGATKVFH
ncbi:MAG: DNA internalization-related competence protein ComEC/Rec2, partial [Deltaproteobacteria bacterium]|nr:DNA internalization-related competence protein ComEC/Rec2 [Deltaproteobacteria bacterium]